MTNSLPSIQDFPVVGIGASAGGLQALQTFFRHMPPAPGMAFVVVMHLSPSHESDAGQLLQACTEMPVAEVLGPVHITPNTVYIVAPNRHIEMIDGYLRVRDRTESTGWPIAIDRFFRTLASAHRSRAFGVVLSGTGTDGVAGLAALKEQGGIVLVQHPDGAEYPSMPRAAIESGGVDFTLPVAEIPAKLINLWNNAQHIALTLPLVAKAAPVPSDSPLVSLGEEETLRDIMSILRARTGHDFTKYKRATVMRRIERRLQVREKPTLAEYRDLMREDRSEAEALLRDMLIGVTQFFRDSDAFDFVEKEVVPQLFEMAKNDHLIRIWSVGCSTGEETYSLAMLMAEHAAKSESSADFQLFGSDIDERAIAIARAGLYGWGITRDVTPVRLSEHFNKEDGRYRIKKSVRDKILFASQNLLRDPPFSKLDMISCRNLLIYLNRDTHAQVLEMFHFALNPGGFLFLGGSESAEAVAEFFVPVDKKHRIYRARVASRLARSSIPIMAPISSAISTPYPDRQPNDKPSFASVHQRVLSEYAPPSVLVDRDSNIVHMSEGTAQFLRHVAGEPSRDLVALAEPELRLELRAALFQAIQSGKSVETRRVRFERGGRVFYVNMVARPFYDAPTVTDFVLVLFHKFEQITGESANSESEPVQDTVLSSLEQELQRTRVQLQDTIENSETSNEELKAANEELQAINEELRSATEELETSKEELQSVNEELITVNFELKNKVEETGKVNDDLQNLIASTDLATIFVDRSMRIKRYTPHASGLFNLIASDIGRPLHDITHRLRYPELANDAAATFESLRPVEREVASEDGRWFIARLLPYRTGLDQIDGAVLTFIDITTRREAEVRARVGEERMRLVADSAKDYAIITMDRDGLITSFNSGAERMFGYREEEVLGQSDEIIFTPEDRAAGVPAEEKRRAHADGRAEDERWHQRKGGGRLFCSGVTTPLLAGEFHGYAKIGRDLTGRQEAESSRAEQLRQEQIRRTQAQLDNQQKDQFLAIMSHELKHPLNLIHMNADVLLRMPVVVQTPAAHKAASAIRSSTISQAKIINDLLDLSRATTGKMELNPTRLDLGALVRNIVEMMSDTPNSAQLELHLPPDADLQVDADEVRIEQVIWNLLSNAVKFTAPEGKVTVTLWGDDTMFHVCVRDTGEGIGAEVLPNIFEIFKQGTAHSNRGVKGLGIGLALVREIMALHHGRVEAQSDGPGRGACFTISLPRPLENVAGAHAEASQSSDLAGLGLLVVDDSEDTLEVFTTLLKMEGARVTAMNSARAALEVLDKERFDVVISDLNMPDMDGNAFVAALRAHEKHSNVPALALTGMSRRQDVEGAMAAGFSGHVVKPVDMGELARQIRRVINQKN
jgi:two-component system CheB/CheR fusion protein